MALTASVIEPRPLPAPPGAHGGMIVRSRFGPVVVRDEGRIVFPAGLLGFAGMTEYALAELPDERWRRFLLLQSLEQDNVSFLVQPLDPESGAIARSDLDEACLALGIPRGELVLLLITSVRRQGESAALSVNLRAPLFVHPEKHRGVQYVLPNNAYPIRCAL